MADVRFDPDALANLFTSPDGPLAKDLERRALSVERAAKRFCPVDTGRLRASITHQQGRDNQGLYVIIGSDVEYAAHVELGTDRQSAQPYLRPAIAEAQ